MKCALLTLHDCRWQIIHMLFEFIDCKRDISRVKTIQKKKKWNFALGEPYFVVHKITIYVYVCIYYISLVCRLSENRIACYQTVFRDFALERIGKKFEFCKCKIRYFLAICSRALLDTSRLRSRKVRVLTVRAVASCCVYTRPIAKTIQWAKAMLASEVPRGRSTVCLHDNNINLTQGNVLTIGRV